MGTFFTIISNIDKNKRNDHLHIHIEYSWKKILLKILRELIIMNIYMMNINICKPLVAEGFPLWVEASDLQPPFPKRGLNGFEITGVDACLGFSR
jgi:hypothetical protein